MKLRLWFSSSTAVGITMFLVGVVFHILGPYFASGLEQKYENRDLFRDWEGWTSTYMLIHPFIYAPVFASIFLGLRRASSFPNGIRGGLIYGAGVFCVGSLPVFLLAFASFQVSVEIILIWIVLNLCKYLAAGVAIGAVTGGVTVRLSTQLSA